MSPNVAEDTVTATATPAPEQTGVAIRVRALVKEYRLGDQTVRALAGVDLDVVAGEFLVIMGPSGSGKSTLLNLVGGLDRPTEGRIEVAGHVVSELDEIELADYRRREVGFVFQSFNLVPTMTARQNVEFPMVFAGHDVSQRAARAEHLLRQVGLGHRIDHRPVELSGGEQQRVAVARAMANRPRLVLADEPTGNLDTETGQEVLALLTELNRAGRTLLTVTHDPRLEQYGHRVVHMQDGRMLREAPGGRAEQAPAHVAARVPDDETPHRVASAPRTSDPSRTSDTERPS